jgi:hexosaminidase
MTPGSHCYFDHYQGEPKNEPIAIGGYTTVEKVYSFNPTPKELSAEEAKYILGAQANLWTEYIETPSHVEYMIFPRMLALSEVLWGTSNPENYIDFQNRLVQHLDILEKKGINYSKSIFELRTKVHRPKSIKGVLFELISAKNTNNIRYTTDGSDPTSNSNIYLKPIEIVNSQTIKAAYFEDEVQKSATIQQEFSVNKATGKKVFLVEQPNENYNSGGALTLVDGIVANNSKLGRDWLGFSGKDLNAIINLGKLETINSVKISFLESQGSWVHYPKNMEVFVSDDGLNFKKVKQISLDEIKKVNGKIELHIDSQTTRFVKIMATNFGKIPDGLPGAGSNAWLFVDEIGVE